MKKTFSVLTLCLMFAVTGCAASSETEEKNVSDIITLSDYTETSSEVILNNVSEQNIVAMFLKSDSQQTFKNDLLIEGGHFQPKEKRLLYVDLSEGHTYDLGLISQGRTYILHNLPFGEADSFNIHITDEYAFLTYKRGKEKISTEESEKEFAAGDAELLQALEAEVPVDDNQAPSMDFVYPETYVDPYANYQNYYYNYTNNEPNYYYYYPETYSEPVDDGGGYVEPEPYVPDSGGGGTTPVDPTPVDPTPVDPTPVDPTPVEPVTPVEPAPSESAVMVQQVQEVPAE